MDKLFEILKAVLYGIIEGITEWLPVSSTGHLILIGDLLPFRLGDETFNAEFSEMFEVVIQLGAILAVVVLFFHKLWPFSPSKTREEKKSTWVLWGKVLIASIPAGLIGVVGDKLLEKITGKDINGWLYNSVVVAVALIVYGILFIVIEKLRKGKANRVETVDRVTCRHALGMGAFQALSMIPGTSRSGSTILGGMCMGLSRTAAAEFSFFMAIPVMAGASLVKALGFFRYVSGEGVSVPGLAWAVLFVGCIVSFAVSMIAIRFLMDFVRKHSFSAFGIYRIALGLLVLGFFLFSRA